MAFNYQSPKQLPVDHSNLKQKSKSSQLITNILQSNTLASTDLQTDN